MKTHTYGTHVHWSSANAEGTKGYRAYSRDHTIIGTGKPEIAASSDPSFRGDASRYNPEELLVASLSSCHMLWYLHLCSVNGIAVVDYSDHASGAMEESEGMGQFVEVALRPIRHCFIARSVSFPVKIEATIA